MNRDDNVEIASPAREEEVVTEKFDEKDVHHPVDDTVTVLGAGEDNGEIATKA
jgi:hypothetical protein